MAKQHFLQANFTGSLGGVTGQNIKGQHVIKQKKWAKCHNGVKSNNACYSFTALHRICCKAAPALADTLLEKTKKMDLIPKLEGMWKSWIENQQFPWDGIKKVAPQNLPITIENMAYNEFSTTITFDTKSTVILPPSTRAEMFFIIHNEVGQVFATHFFPYTNNQITIQLAGIVEHHLYMSGIILVNYGNKWHFESPFAESVYNWQP